MNTYLVFSPHLDDAVLSCGAQIALWTAEGHTVFVATVFNIADEAQEQHYTRRVQDDETAVAQLGATAIYLNFPDAPFRDPGYHNFSTLLLHERLPAEAKEVANTLGPILQMVAEDVAADAVYLPLAVGGHVDHLAVFEAGKIFWNTTMPVFYYEELPYALVPGWRTLRWQQHGATLQLTETRGDYTLSRLQDLPFAFLKNYMMDEADLQASEARHLAQLSPHLPVMNDAPAWSIGPQRFTSNPSSFAQPCFEQKITAIRCYASEWPVLFGPLEEDIIKTLGQPFNRNGYTEIYWTLNR